ncbi:hypothetical protein WG66_002275, partial [Moniliophthora roreri]
MQLGNPPFDMFFYFDPLIPVQHHFCEETKYERLHEWKSTRDRRSELTPWVVRH